MRIARAVLFAASVFLRVLASALRLLLSRDRFDASRSCHAPRRFSSSITSVTLQPAKQRRDTEPSFLSWTPRDGLWSPLPRPWAGTGQRHIQVPRQTSLPPR